MLGMFSFHEMEVRAAQKLEQYRKEVRHPGQGSTWTLQRQLAKMFRYWAEALEPSQPEGTLGESHG
ncbi:hypothetical protein DV704_10195 [Meiothermus sp. QL-1]|nr:hypothetical protein DV704_10195 [Meiothermus sp. QL-1]